MNKQIEQPRKTVFPLSSKRLKRTSCNSYVAQALELPTSASNNDLRVMVEEKLRAMDRNPLNTQVVVDLQEEGTENLSLQDEEGQFLHVTFPVLSPDSSNQPNDYLGKYQGITWVSTYTTKFIFGDGCGEKH